MHLALPIDVFVEFDEFNELDTNLYKNAMICKIECSPSGWMHGRPLQRSRKNSFPTL